MACYHPLKGFLLGIKDNGKKDLKICSYDVEYIVHAPWQDVKRYDYTHYDTDLQWAIVDDFIEIPCGQCLGCRLEYSRQWAIRCMLESEYHEHNYFITLTYAPEHVPKSTYLNYDGSFGTSLTLKPDDVTKFLKRLRSFMDRKRGGTKFRYYLAGEYGSQTARPHYHILAFGLPIDDLVLKEQTPYGNYYTSETLESIWKKGNIIIGGVSFESCAYVARYIMKKQKGKSADVYEEYNIVPEFVRMSRRPGIGKSYFDDNFEDIYPKDSIVLTGGKLTRPPRYFDTLMDAMDEKLMKDVKDKRKDIAEKINAYKYDLSSATYLNQLEHAENNQEAKLKKLARTLD